MARRRKRHPKLENIEIIDIAAEGKAIGKIDEQVVFVSNVIPGDIVDIQVTKKQKNFMEGFATAIHQSSPDRQEAFCEHFGVCGGCKWQMLPYDLQLKYKQKQVVDHLERIGKIDIPDIRPIISSDHTRFYRNKLEYTFSEGKWLTREEIESGEDIENRNALGFHISGRFDKVLDLNNCYLQEAPSNEIRLKIRDFANKEGYQFFNQRKQEGFLRNLIIRNSSSGEVMVILSFYKENTEKINKLLDYLKNTFENITSLLYVINPKANDTIHDQEIITYSGRDYIIEQINGVKYRIGPKSFFQINPWQTKRMYKIAADMASLSKEDIVYDLYTGTGTIALFIADRCKEVVGIEYVPEAIEDAHKNAAYNNIGNSRFYAGDIKDLLNEDFIKENGTPNVIITDPPRAGMHKDVVKSILKVAPERIVYISCNPATQARDINLLSEKYAVTQVQPIDMFPHTHHVENIVKLELH